MTDRELEARLGAFYRTDVGEGETAPLALRREVVAIPRTVPQREHWFGRGRGLTFLAAGALMLVGGALAAGSGLVRLPSLMPPRPAPSLAVVPTRSPAPTNSGLALRPGQSNIGDHRLVSDSVGWVSTPAALFRTDNLGRTWSLVTPPGWSAGRGSRDLFIDADTAYTFLPGSGTIAVTHDAGATWVQTVLDGTADGSPSFWFQTPQSGSLVFFGLQKSDPSTTFGTTDGGLTWTGPRQGPSEDSRWPFAVALITQGTPGVVVRVSMPGGLDLAKAVLQISHDAGATWVDRPYPAIPQAFTGPDTVTPAHPLTVWGDAAGHIVLAIASIYVDTCVAVCQDTMLYTSADDGRSWQYVPTAAPMHLSIDTQFLSPTEWVLLSAGHTNTWYDPETNGLTFKSTLDGGANWRTTTRSAPFPAGGVSFATPDIGWAISSCEPTASQANDFVCDPADTKSSHRTILIQTTDGGLTWASIGE